MQTAKKKVLVLSRLTFLVVLAFALAAPLSVSRTSANVPAGSAAQAVVDAYSVEFKVISARTEPKAFNGAGVLKDAPIDAFKYQVNVDNTGDPFAARSEGDPCDIANPNYPDGCDLPSVRTVPGWSPIYTHGNQATNLVTGMPDGKYLVSVTAEGYKIDGEHFSIPAVNLPDTDGDGIPEVTVALHPLPLPPATMVIKVFNDNSMTNGQHDGPSEDGLPGFRASINDILGEITTDVFGNPLCTIYKKDPVTGEVLLDSEGAPEIEQLGAGCYSNTDGDIIIPNIGPLRYDVLVFPPAGENWVQTTTLEGAPGWDTWLQEGGTGLDNEFLVAAEPFPWTVFGYVKAMDPLPDLGGTGSITGVVMAASTFVPTEGGLPYIGDTFAGYSGTKLHRPIVKPWLSLNSLIQGDTALWVGQGNDDGSFNIPNVPAGNYLLTYWDDKQHYILDFVQVTVEDGMVADVGIRMLTGWFTEISGYVFDDLNFNGKRDAGEPGVPNYLVVLKDRDNTEIDRMSIASATTGEGFYELEKGYPMGSWMILEAYSDLFRTTGVTYQTLNMPDPITINEPIVDIGVLPILGQPVQVDWGVTPYLATETGGIAGTVFYDTVRAEDDARYAGIEPWQPGIPGLEMRLYQAVTDIYGNLVLEPEGGAAKKGQLLNVASTETFKRPTGCIVRDVDGIEVNFPSIPDSLEKDCLEGPLMGTQIGSTQNELDGNWGFGDGCFGDTGGFNVDTGLCVDGSEPTPLEAGHYLVEVVIPDDASGEPMLQVTREEDINTFDGDTYVPQVPPPACVGPLHIVDVEGVATDGYPGYTTPEGITIPASTPVSNPGLAETYYPRFEGEVKPLCNVKHVYLSWGKAVAPVFTLFSDVPIPGKWKGYIIDNLNVSVDPNTLFFGEMAGVPEVPIGLYDYSGRLVHTVHSDYNGVYEVLLPSTDTYNAPTPSGMFANVYYLYGNDPGPTGAPNTRYNPQYRSIGTSFEIYPGVIIPSDLAPTQNGAAVWAPGAQNNSLALCKLDDIQPQLFRVDEVYGPPGSSLTIWGKGFGDIPGSVTLNGVVLEASLWANTQIDVTIPADMPAGAWQLLVHGSNGLSTVNGLTYHVIGEGYAPTVYRVGPGETYDPANYDGTSRGPIQHAIDDAAAAGGSALVVVYPGAPSAMVNPQGWYLENLILHAAVKLQGVGPGGIFPDGVGMAGSVIDGRAVGGDSPYNLWWRETFIPTLWTDGGGWDRAFVDQDGVLVFEGAVITVLANDGEFTDAYKASIDGFIIQGGDQQGFPNNRNLVGGAPIPGVQPNVVVQGGGIFVNGYARHLQITNNLIQANGGSFGGAIRLGTPHIPAPDTSNYNEFTVIAHNRILANGGTNLAGGLAIFAGADNYDVSYNDFCGNSSIEYGGGISHYGYSPNGEIHHNRIYFNSSYDEGGGIMIAGELPADPETPSPGAGSVSVYENLIQSNLANDDGGGLRFLMAGGRVQVGETEIGEAIYEHFVFNVTNNIITNNVSTHEGGGISLNDAPYVNIVNNTVANNITTATAMTSTGIAAPAGLSTSRNSALMQGILPTDAPLFSNPVLLNNIFYGNRAGSFDGNSVTGLGLPDDPSAIFYWDVGVADSPDMLDIESNLVAIDPLFVSPYDTSIQIFAWRGNANFVGAHLVAMNLPINLQGDYHLNSLGSPAKNYGVASKLGVSAPAFDIDSEVRPGLSGIDAGADEYDVSTPVVTTVLDNFNRANGALGANWRGSTQTSTFRINNNAVQVRASGAVWWNPASFSFAQEAFFTLSRVVPNATEQGLVMNLDGPSVNGRTSSWVKVVYNSVTQTVDVITKTADNNTPVLQASIPATFSNGQVLGARYEPGGWVTVFQNGAIIGNVQVTGWAPLATGGKIGIVYTGLLSNTNYGLLDDFGGGSLP